VWSVAAFALSLLAKEETVALPAFLLLYDYVLVARQDAGWVAGRRWYYAALLACAGLAAARLFYVLHSLPDPGVGFRVRGVSPTVYALSQPRVIWRYVRLVVLPVGQNLDYDLRPSASLLNPPGTLIAILALAGLLVTLAVLLRREARSASPAPGFETGQPWAAPAFWALGFFLLLAPSSSIIAQSDLIFEHRTYLPLISLVVALAWALHRGLQRVAAPGIRVGAVGLLLGTCAVGTMARNQVWATELSLWSDVVRKSPNKGRPYIGLARGLAEAHRGQEARRALERGVELDPANHELHTNLGVLLLEEGNASKALEHFRRALQLDRQTPEAWNNIGAALYQLQDREEAIATFRRALALSPCFYNSRRNLMMALSEAGRKNEALEAGKLPAGCVVLPDQARDLEEYRRQIAQSAAGSRQ